MLNVHQILDNEGKRGVEIFQDLIEPYKATGKTAQSAYHKVEGKGEVVSLEILAREFTDVLEKGSRRARTQVPSKEMIDSLKPWAQARGIPDEAVYGIAVKLLKEGQKVSRNVYSKQMNKFADEVADTVTDELAGYVVDEIEKAFA